MGCFSTLKGVPNKRYTGEIKQMVVETLHQEKLSHSETERRFGVVRSQITAWNGSTLRKILSIERRDRGSKSRPRKYF